MYKKLRNNRGVTMVEIMITVVLIGIVAAMATPHLQRAFEKLRFQSANKHIMSALRLARSKAVAEKNMHGIYFNANDMQVVLFRKDTASVSESQYEDSTDIIVKTYQMPSEFSYMSTDISNNTVVFRPNGSATFTGGGNIYTMAYDGYTVGMYGINILGSTGRVKTASQYYY